MADVGARGHVASVDLLEAGREMQDFITDLYPTCRSITGQGLRSTLRAIRDRVPLQIHEIPSGTQVLDWTVPQEWNITDAYIKDSAGRRIVDFQECNLHVVNYSEPVDLRLTLQELLPHLHSLADHPDWIPYRTSYYKRGWGFCLPDAQLQQLGDGEYDVHIASSLEDGHLSYGELVVPGASSDEVLFSTHACHPSLCNDNLSGVALATQIAKCLSGATLRYSYRFLFIPGTIGSITWLARNEDGVSRIKHGLVIACVGDPGAMTYKRSRRHAAEIDRAVTHVLAHRDAGHNLLDFSPYGYDERQYCSPGFNLPVGCLSRTPHGCFPEYHTSADDLAFVRPEWLADSLDVCLSVIDVLEGNRTYVNRSPKGEPQLGRRGLYPSMGGKEAEQAQLAMLWALNLSDGTNTLLDIAERSRMDFSCLRDAATVLLEHGLLQEC